MERDYVSKETLITEPANQMFEVKIVSNYIKNMFNTSNKGLNKVNKHYLFQETQLT